MNERDVLRGYRAANEALDEAPREGTRAAILAAAARAVEAKPRAVDRMRHWRFPLAAAATVLISTVAVIVATRTEQEAAKLAAVPPETGAQPSADIYAPEPPAAAPAAPPPAPGPGAETPQAAPAQAAPRPAAPAKRLEAPAEKFEAPAVAAAPAAPRAAADAVASSEGRAERGATNGESAGLRAARERAPAATATELAPAQWIERIVALRAAGRDEEADRELKRFRERYPDFKLPPAALRKQAAEGK
ncbi:MAG: hypothetical protein AMXMBFR72_10130 [Betaproteobacteria bacterium]|jgi:hypothetical protein